MADLFEYYIEGEGFHLKYAKGEPSAKGREFHDYHEFLFFINGEASFVSKNIQSRLSPGSVVLIPKEHFHRFFVEHPETYTRCVFGFRGLGEISDLASEVMDTVKIIAKPDEKITSVFENLMGAAKSDLSEREKSLFIRASLVQLLIFLKGQISTVISNSVKLSPVVMGALNIIDEKYSENLTVEGIAKSLYVSASTLSHKFSKELSISVYQYIIKKRLSAANELIQSGKNLTRAAAESGFSDYSCFFRLYKKYYGDRSKL